MKAKKITALVFTSVAILQSAWAQKFNIVYILTDQQTASAMSCTGNSALKTPNLDRLASEGIRFTNAYCTAPLCTPSRAAMFTGLTPSVTRQTVNNSAIPDTIKPKTLGNLLKKVGYECVYAGKWHLPTPDIEEGTFGFHKLYGHNDIGLAESAVSFLEQKHEKPFFLVVSIDNPHNICEYARSQPLPFATITEPPIEQCPNLPANFAVAPYDADVIREEQHISYKKYPIVSYTNDDWRRYRNAYYRLVEFADQEIGKVLKALINNSLLKNTVIVFSSDHGDGNASHHWNQKSALYEEVVNIPLIARLPDARNRGTIRDQIINNGPDFFATICDFAGADVPSNCAGKSIRPLMENSSNSELHDCIVTETQFDASTTKGWMVRTPQYKYVIYDKGRYREQLYDIKNDRGEMINLAVENSYFSVLQRHRELLLQWKKKNGLSVNNQE